MHLAAALRQLLFDCNGMVEEAEYCLPGIRQRLNDRIPTRVCLCASLVEGFGGVNSTKNPKISFFIGTKVGKCSYRN